MICSLLRFYLKSPNRIWKNRGHSFLVWWDEFLVNFKTTCLLFYFHSVLFVIWIVKLAFFENFLNTLTWFEYLSHFQTCFASWERIKNVYKFSRHTYDIQTVSDWLHWHNINYMIDQVILFIKYFKLLFLNVK